MRIRINATRVSSVSFLSSASFSHTTMAATAATVYKTAGFDFSNQIRSVLTQSSQRTISPTLDRNNFLADRGIPLPKATSTGTTIVGCLFKDGIILGADTRATEGDIVADKNCEKVSSESPLPVSRIISLSDSLHHRVHPMLWCWYRRRHRVHDSNDIQ